MRDVTAQLSASIFCSRALFVAGWSLFLCCTSLACVDARRHSATGVQVFVTNDYDASSVHEVHIAISGHADPLVFTGDAYSFGLQPSAARDAWVVVSLSGYDKSAQLVTSEQAFRLRFVPGEQKVVYIALSKRCPKQAERTLDGPLDTWNRVAPTDPAMALLACASSDKSAHDAAVIHPDTGLDAGPASEEASVDAAPPSATDGDGGTEPEFTMLKQSYADLAHAPGGPDAGFPGFGLPSGWQVIEGDFDGDGTSDYARLGALGEWAFFSNRDGTFAHTYKSYVNESPPLDFYEPSTWQVVTGDFNGDHRSDHVRLGDTGAWVFLANDQFSFTRGFQIFDPEAKLHFSEDSPWQLVRGDFDGDKRSDYARLGDTEAWVFFGTADGGFTRRLQSYVDGPKDAHFGLPSMWQAIDGDFNGDQRTDYARLGATRAWIFFGGEDGSFTFREQSYTDQEPHLNFGEPSNWQVVTGDFNGDKRTDYARLGATQARVFFANGDGSFTHHTQSYAALDFGQPSRWQVIAGDFDADGCADYARLGDVGAWLFKGKRDGSFASSYQDYRGLAFGDPSRYQVVAGDFNGDHRTDYARLGSDEAFVFLHR